MNDLEKVSWVGDLKTREWEVLVERRWIKVRGKSLYDALFCSCVRGTDECVAYMLATSRFGYENIDFEFNDVMCSDAWRAVRGDNGHQKPDAILEIVGLSREQDIRISAASCDGCSDLHSVLLRSDCEYFYCPDCCRDSGFQWPCCHDDMRSIDVLKLSTLE